MDISDVVFLLTPSNLEVRKPAKPKKQNTRFIATIAGKQYHHRRVTSWTTLAGLFRNMVYIIQINGHDVCNITPNQSYIKAKYGVGTTLSSNAVALLTNPNLSWDEAEKEIRKEVRRLIESGLIKILSYPENAPMLISRVDPTTIDWKKLGA